MQIADMHCDTIMKLWYAELRGEPASITGDGEFDRSLHINLNKLETGGYILQNFALFTNQSLPAAFDGRQNLSNYFGVSNEEEYRRLDPWIQAKEMIRVFKREMEENSSRIRQVFRYKDIEENQREGRISAVLTTEEGCIIGEDLTRLDELYKAGVRMMTVTWNFANQLGVPNRPDPEFKKDFSKFFAFKPDPDSGLTDFGKEAAAAMAEKGILVDVSHLSDGGFWDVAEIVHGPFVASHSNARAVTGVHRNLTDDMIRTIAEHGGVIGLNFCPAFTSMGSSADQCLTNAETLARHLKHMLNVGGREILALGTDFDGISPAGLEIHDASEMQMLADGLRKEGIEESILEGLFYKNLLRLYREVLK
ncbi:MAG: membrane dipeptidase [Eubacteriales bacterium]|nr:membrane dipeptidase [Eubacteriales bacterium]